VFVSAPTTNAQTLIIGIRCPRRIDPGIVGTIVPMRRWGFGSLTYCFEEQGMGKYFLGWILGVPAIVLVAIYIFMH
jgi:hypothetical protein